MGLLLTKNTKAILIQGTDIELNSVYVRISVNCPFDGKTISVTYKSFASHDAYLQGKELYTDINHLNYEFTILNTEIKHSVENRSDKLKIHVFHDLRRPSDNQFLVLPCEHR